MKKSEKADGVIPSRDTTLKDTGNAAVWLGIAPKTLRNYRVAGSTEIGPRYSKDARGRAWYAIQDLDAWKHTRQTKVDATISAPREMTPEEKLADAERRNRWAEEEDLAFIAWKKSLPVPGTRYPVRGKDPSFSLGPVYESERYWCKEGPEWVVMARYNEFNRFHPQASHIHKSETERGEKWLREELPRTMAIARSMRASNLKLYGKEDPHRREEKPKPLPTMEEYRKVRPWLK